MKSLQKCAVLVFLSVFLSVLIYLLRSYYGPIPISLGRNEIQYDSSLRRVNIPIDDEPRIVCQAKKGERMQVVTIPEFYNSTCWHKFPSVTFFHVGKGGGGTVGLDLHENRIALGRTAHPGPRLMDIEQLQRGSASTLVINIRDPVDRFVSAFRWRVALLCRLNDTRTPAPGYAHINPHETCDPAYRKEEHVLREIYDENPNNLAEALCSASPTNKDAAVHYFKVTHSATLSKWLNFLTDKQMLRKMKPVGGIKQIIALPMEKRQDEILFEEHIQQLSLYLLQTKYTKEIAENILKQMPQRKIDVEKKERGEHSSARFHNSTGSTSLSTLGECCLARHLEMDYHLIQTMITGQAGNRTGLAPLVDYHPVISSACAWGNAKQQHLCIADLRAMIMRRARYLDRSLGSCHSQFK